MICSHVPLFRDVTVCICNVNCIRSTYRMCVYELTHTFDSSVIQVVAKWTFTAEGAISVNTDAIFTRVIQTFIHICTRGKKQVCYKGHMKVITDFELNFKVRSTDNLEG